MLTKEELVKEIPCLNCIVMPKCIIVESSKGVVCAPCGPYWEWKKIQIKLFANETGFFEIFKKLLEEKR